MQWRQSVSNTVRVLPLHFLPSTSVHTLRPPPPHGVDAYEWMNESLLVSIGASLMGLGSADLKN